MSLEGEGRYMSCSEIMGVRPQDCWAPASPYGCFWHLPIIPDIELKGGSSSEGNVFVYGKPVCDDYWGRRDADVACRMLGYDPSTFSYDLQYSLFERYSGGEPTKQSTFGEVPSKFSMDDVKCTGNEKSLLDCRYKTKDNCGAGEGAGVRCSTSIPSRSSCLFPNLSHFVYTSMSVDWLKLKIVQLDWSRIWLKFSRADWNFVSY